MKKLVGGFIICIGLIIKLNQLNHTNSIALKTISHYSGFHDQENL